ncbi:MAG: AraC family transcriptional regulator [bacterium]
MLHQLSTSDAVPHFGVVIRREVFGMFTVTEARYAPGMSTAWHRHSTAAVSLVVHGECTERFRGRSIERGTGTVLFRPPQVEHRDHIGVRGATCLFLEPSSDWGRCTDSGVLGVSEPTLARGVRAHWVLKQAHGELMEPDDVSPLVVEGLVMMLVAEGVRSNVRAGRQRIPLWLKRTRDTLHDRYADRVSLAELARDAGVHPSHLTAAYRRTFGVSPGEYLRARRVEEAQRALRDTGASITEIALNVGFSDQSHLTRTFRSHTGQTPARYRSSFRPTATADSGRIVRNS